MSAPFPPLRQAPDGGQALWLTLLTLGTWSVGRGGSDGARCRRGQPRAAARAPGGSGPGGASGGSSIKQMAANGLPPTLQGSDSYDLQREFLWLYINFI